MIFLHCAGYLIHGGNPDVNRLEAGNRLSASERVKEARRKRRVITVRKMLSAALLMCTVALLSALSMAAVSAQPNKPLRCEMEMTVFWTTPPHWEGTVTGDIVGSIIVTEGTPSFPGKTEHFAETFVITTVGGDTIEGFDEGVWSFKTFFWVANGRVTDATGRWAYLVGSQVQEIGTTTPFPAEEVTGYGRMTIVYG